MPTDRFHDIRRALLAKLDALKINSDDFRKHAATSDVETGIAADELRKQALEATALVKELMVEIDAAILLTDVDNTGREHVAPEERRRPDPGLMREAEAVRKVLDDVLSDLDQVREPETGIQELAQEDIEDWARQRRGDVNADDQEPLR